MEHNRPLIELLVFYALSLYTFPFFCGYLWRNMSNENNKRSREHHLNHLKGKMLEKRRNN